MLAPRSTETGESCPGEGTRATLKSSTRFSADRDRGHRDDCVASSSILSAGAIQLAIIAVVAMILHDPLVVVNRFVVVLPVIVVVVRVIDAIGSGSTAHCQDWRGKSDGQQERAQVSISTGH
jgi:hypothetical protein